MGDDEDEGRGEEGYAAAAVAAAPLTLASSCSSSSFSSSSSSLSPLLSTQLRLLSRLSHASVLVSESSAALSERLSSVAHAWPSYGRRLTAVRAELQSLHSALACIERQVGQQRAGQSPPADDGD